MPLRIDSVTMEPQGNPPTWGVSNALTPTSVAINVTDEISETEMRKCNLYEELSDTFFELCKSSFDLHINILNAVANWEVLVFMFST